MSNGSGVMASVDQRTQLVGQNRMELLMFRLPASNQLYGINVFKVREVTQCPRLTVVPASHPVVRGIADFRGVAIPVIDFSMGIGETKTTAIEESLVIISEYNRRMQALLVDSVDRIVNMSWNAIRPPPAGAKGTIGSYLTAVCEVENQLVEIIDVERIIDEVTPNRAQLAEELAKDVETHEEQSRVVLVADDSSVARNQIQRTMEALGLKAVTVSDGKQALDLLKQIADDGKDPSKEFMMLISDIEMPNMDGYTLVTEIRFDDRLSDLYVVLHTSLSGVFNRALVEKVGANNFIAKFQPDVLAKEVQTVIASFNK